MSPTSGGKIRHMIVQMTVFLKRDPEDRVGREDEAVIVEADKNPVRVEPVPFLEAHDHHVEERIKREHAVDQHCRPEQDPSLKARVLQRSLELHHRTIRLPVRERPHVKRGRRPGRLSAAPVDEGLQLLRRFGRRNVARRRHR